MTQTIEYVVKVNATQAQAAVADVEKRFGGVDTVVARVDKSIIALERDMKDLNAAIAAGGPNVEHYRKELDALGQAAGRAVGGKSGQGNMGQGLLMFSQTLDDAQYGVRGIVNNIPGLVQGLGMGMGVAGVAQVAMIAVSQLTDKVTGFIKKQQEASQAAIVIRNSILDMRIASGQTTEDLRKRLEEIKVEAVGGRPAVLKAQTDKEVKDLETSITNNEQRLERIRKQTLERFPEATRLAAMGDANRLMSDTEKREANAIKLRIDADKESIENAKENLRLRLEIAKAEEEAAKKAAARFKGGGGGASVERDYAVSFEEQAAYGTGFRGQTLMSTILEDTAKRQAEAAQDASDLENEIRQEMLKHEEKNNAAAEKLDRERTRELDRQARERQQIREREAEHARRLHEQEVDYLTQMGTTAAAAIGTFAAQSAAGQEEAFQNLLGTASMQAGGIIMLEGGKVMAAGISGMLTAPNPISAAQIVGGGALVAAGAAVQTGGPAVISSLMSIATGGGGKQAAAKDRGASPRSGSGGGGGSGGLVVNVSYGAGGPLPEDIAREIDKVVKSNDRRRGAA
jgi:hypothetical protein